MPDPTVHTDKKTADDTEQQPKPNQPPGFYDDENRVDSGRDAEFGGNQGMGSYSQHSDYRRHLDETAPPTPEPATQPHQHGPSNSGATGTIEKNKNSKE